MPARGHCLFAVISAQFRVVTGAQGSTAYHRNPAADACNKIDETCPRRHRAPLASHRRSGLAG
ncbi:hypothetical protein AB0L63_16390 [Nocardia sp. NPDC051990]|uniref:hypothetical protein n=1 Tax=Nocardia sp. NPDC051990 TaxID=3155285 RepID=UPI00342DFCBE